MNQAKVGKFIAQLRHEQGLTQEALGRKIGVTNKTVSRWENGNYMPDIELLAPLGEMLGVSVNELLAGERLTDERFRKQADKNLVEAVRESSFSVKERTEFFKKKWLREHLWLFAVCALACILLVYLLVWRWDAAPLAWAPVILEYCWLRNRMMIYVESKVYGDPRPPAAEE